MRLFREVYSFRLSRPFPLERYGWLTAFINGKLLAAGDQLKVRLDEFTGGYGKESAAVIPWVKGSRIVGVHVGTRQADPLTPHVLSMLDGLKFDDVVVSRDESPDFFVAQKWATVTPIEVEYPDKKKVGEYFNRRVESRIRKICESNGLPRLVAVTVKPDSPHTSIAADQFLTWHIYRQVNRTRYFRTHAVLEFESPVAGPLVIGNGRNGGGGLMFPVC